MHFIKSISALQMFKILFWYLLQMFNNPDSPNDFISYFQPLFDKEVTEVSLVREDRPNFQLVHYCKDRSSCLNMQLKIIKIAFG